jgi:hypothetical protein
VEITEVLRMIPANINQVDTRWLGKVLNAGVTSLNVTQIGQGVGIMGDIYRVALTYEDGATGPASVVVKLPSSFEENRAQGVALGMFEAEVRFYNELADQVSSGLPAIYRAEITPGSAEFVIVMQDLSDLSLVDQSDGMSVEQASAAVDVLAQVHAVWWDRAQGEDLEWIQSMVGPRIEFVDQILPDLMPVFASGFGDHLPPGGLDLFELFAGNYLKVTSVLAARSPWTLVHQDFRVENLLFGPPGSGRVIILDWQGIGRGPGAYDLAYLLGGSMDTDLRRDHENDLVTAYHNRLIDLGISDYAFADLWDDYQLSHLMGGLATPVVIGGGMDLANERGRNLVINMARRHVTAALDHDGPARLRDIVHYQPESQP